MSALFLVAHFDDVAGRRSLSVFTPIISLSSHAGLLLVQNLHVLLQWGALGAVGLLAVLAVQRKSVSHALFFLGVSIAVLTQWILIDGETRLEISAALNLSSTPNPSVTIAIWAGILGYAISCCLILLAYRSPNAPGFDSTQNRNSNFGWLDFCLLLAAITVGSLLRTYALNQHFNYFEGELSPYSAAATSLSGMFYANRGYNGPWAPLGLLYYLPIYVTTSSLGTTLLALRLSSALVGIFTILLVFLLANRIAGRVAGLFAAALFSLNCLHIGWSRTDIHPHGVTTWPTLLMCFFLLRAADTKKLIWAFGVACVMGLSWHQYPSGQSAVVIPIIAIALFCVCNRGTSPLTKGQLAVVALGVVLWSLGLPLSYYPIDGQMIFFNPFTLTGPRALWGSEGLPPSVWDSALFVVFKAGRHFWDFLQGVFFRVPYLFHQEWLPSTPPLSTRSVPWFVVSLAMTALAVLLTQRKRFESAVLVGWLVAAILPGILSEHAYPKRLSTAFPLFDILAGVGCSFIFAYLNRFSWALSRLIALALVFLSLTAYTLYSVFFWFSGNYFSYGPPPEIAMARELERAITPRTLVISGLGSGYELGKFLYLMLDYLAAPENRPNLFVLLQNNSLEPLLANPSLDPQQIAGTIPYSWTKLRHQLSESLSVKDWENVTFLLVENIHNSPMNTQAISLAVSSCPNPTIRHVVSSTNTPTWTMLSIASITCKTSEMVRPPTIDARK